MTGNVTMSRKVAELEQQLICPITLGQMKAPYRLHPCGHTFEGHEILSWLKLKSICPLDRSIVVSATPDTDLREAIDEYEHLKKNNFPEEGVDSLEFEIAEQNKKKLSASKIETIARVDFIKEKLSDSQEKGLYLFGNCNHQNCSLKEQQVHVFRGTGRFSINKESATTECKDCSLPIVIDAIAIWGKNYQLEGMKVTDDEEIVASSLENENQKFKIIYPLSEWRFLDIRIEGTEISPSVNEKKETAGAFECFKSSWPVRWIKNFAQEISNLTNL